MKEFNLTEYLKNPSQKVVTRDGRNVRIICTDAKGDEPIIALIYNKNREEENVYAYNRDGYFYRNNDSCLDLFFATIKKEGWINVYKAPKYIYVDGKVFDSKYKAVLNKTKSVQYLTTIQIEIEWEE